MQSKEFMERAEKISVGSLSPTINWKSLRDEDFALPSLEEQDRICKVLSEFENVTALLHDAREAAHSAKESCAAELFPHDPATTVTPLSDVCDEITVGIVVKPARWYVNDPNGVPALIMKNVQRGWVDLTELLYISHAGHRVHTKSMLRTGDVVAVRSSGSASRTGDAAVVPPSLHGANCIDLLIARSRRTLMPEYLREFLNAPTTRAKLVGSSSGTMQKHLNVGAFRLLKIPMRPLSEQKRLVGELENLTAAALDCDRRRAAAFALREALPISWAGGI